MLRKHSKKRDEILKILRGTETHPTAQWIYDKLKTGMPALSLGTVYRNLSIFCEEGSAVRVGVLGGEEHFDAKVMSHPHLVCTKCGSIIDLPPPDESALRHISTGLPGIKIDYRKTVFHGLCPLCTAKTQVRKGPVYESLPAS
jgi:Fur family peroxide stress response transcriptional regulator